MRIEQVRVEIVYHHVAEPSFHEWQSRFLSRRFGGRELFGTVIAAIEHELTRSQGRPANARRVGELEPPIMAWEYQYRDTWIIYVVERKGGILSRVFGRIKLRITVAQIFDHPPHPAEIEALARTLRTWGRSGSE